MKKTIALSLLLSFSLMPITGFALGEDEKVDVSQFFAPKDRTKEGGIFGTELTLTNKDILKDTGEGRTNKGFKIPFTKHRIHRTPGSKFKLKNTYFSPMLYQRQQKWMDLMEDQCVAKGCHVDRKKNRITYDDGWYFNVTLDEGVLEITSKPLTAAGHAANEARVQRDIFDFANSNLEIKPDRSAGGGHVHIDVESNFVDKDGKVDAVLLRNFIVDMMNHSDIFMGPMGVGVSNSPLSIEGQQAIEEMKKVLYDLDERICNPETSKPLNPDQFKEILAFATNVMSKVYGDAFLPHRKPLSFKAHAINLCGLRKKTLGARFRRLFSESCTIPTVEIRGFRPQQSANDATLETAMLHNRIQYLREKYGKKPIPLKTKADFDYEKYEEALEKQNAERVAKGKKPTQLLDLFSPTTGLMDRDKVTASLYDYIVPAGGNWSSYKQAFITTNPEYPTLRKAKDPIEKFHEYAEDRKKKAKFFDNRNKQGELTESSTQAAQQQLKEEVEKLKKQHHPRFSKIRSLDNRGRYLILRGLEVLKEAKNRNVDSQVTAEDYLTDEQIRLMRDHLHPSFLKARNIKLREVPDKTSETVIAEAQDSTHQSDFDFGETAEKLERKLDPKAVGPIAFDSYVLSSYQQFTEKFPEELPKVDNAWNRAEKKLRDDLGLKTKAKLIKSPQNDRTSNEQIQVWEKKYEADLSKVPSLSPEDRYMALMGIDILNKAQQVRPRVSGEKYLVARQARVLKKIFGEDYLQVATDSFLRKQKLKDVDQYGVPRPSYASAAQGSEAAKQFTAATQPGKSTPTARQAVTEQESLAPKAKPQVPVNAAADPATRLTTKKTKPSLSPSPLKERDTNSNNSPAASTKKPAKSIATSGKENAEPNLTPSSTEKSTNKAPDQTEFESFVLTMYQRYASDFPEVLAKKDGQAAQWGELETSLRKQFKIAEGAQVKTKERVATDASSQIKTWEKRYNVSPNQNEYSDQERYQLLMGVDLVKKATLMNAPVQVDQYLTNQQKRLFKRYFGDNYMEAITNTSH